MLHGTRSNVIGGGDFSTRLAIEGTPKVHLLFGMGVRVHKVQAFAKVHHAACVAGHVKAGGTGGGALLSSYKAGSRGSSQKVGPL